VSPDEVPTRNEHYFGPLFLKGTGNCQGASFVEFTTTGVFLLLILFIFSDETPMGVMSCY